MPLETILLGLAVLVLAAAVWRLGSRWAAWRGRRVIECPENHRPAGVTVDAAHAAKLFGNTPDLRLSSCSRWPERAGCGQECLSQIQASPEECLVRHILAQWYEGKTCAQCGQPFGTIEWAAAKPALLRPDGISVDWDSVPAEQLRETMAAAKPVCFACHTANKLVHEHPELALDRGRTPVA